VVPAVTGKSWDEFLRERIFMPLRMERTTTAYKDLLATSNLAAPHNEADDKLRVIRYDNVNNAAAAGAIHSSVSEMAQWIRLQLGRGTLDGKKIFSAERAREMWSPHTVAGAISEAAEKFNPTTHFNLYGLGWGLSDYHGRKVISHGGGLMGMISRVALMPEEKLGMVLLSNSETPLANILSSKIFDVFLNVPKRDWSAEFLARSKQAEETAKAMRKKVEDSRLPNTKPSLPLSAYTGTYSGTFYGDARVTEENGKLVLRLVPAPHFVGDMEHWHLDTFSIKWRDSVTYQFGRGFVSFIVDSAGKVSELKFDIPNRDFNFSELELKRVP
jgi:CubicO group peptidase (beta-lactamase class C family)